VIPERLKTPAHETGSSMAFKFVCAETGAKCLIVVPMSEMSIDTPNGPLDA
jgi:hypothetical protein